MILHVFKSAADENLKCFLSRLAIGSDIIDLGGVDWGNSKILGVNFEVFLEFLGSNFESQKFSGGQFKKNWISIFDRKM